MKKILFLILYSILPFLVYPQQSVMMQNMGDYSNERAMDITTDQNGNVYVCGHFLSDTLFAGTSFLIRKSFDTDAFLIKFDMEGELLWLDNPGGPFMQEIRSVSCDPEGNVYVGGIFRGAFGFGSSYLEALGLEDAMLLKYDPEGNPLWGISLGSYGEAEIINTACGPEGNIYVTGEFLNSDLYVEDTIITCQGNNDVFTACFNPQGGLIWVSGCGAPGGEFIKGLSPGPEGSVYISGAFNSDELILGNDTLINNAFVRAAFAVQYDQSGYPIWTLEHDDGYDQSYHNVICDAEGNIYLGGYFKTEFVFPNITFYTNGSQFDAFFEMYDSQHQGGWAKHMYSNDYDRTNDVTCDENGNIYLTLFSMGDINIEDIVVSNEGGRDFMVLKYNSFGEMEWLRTVGGAEDDECMALAYKAPYNLYYSGYYRSEYIYWGQHYVENMGQEDAFYGKVYTYLGAGTGDDALPSEVSFYPNPFRDEIHFNHKMDHVALYTLDGRLIMEKEQATSLDIPADLPQATYLLKINGKDKTISQYYKVIHR